MIAESFGKRNDLGPVSAGAAIIHAGLVILSVMGPSLGAVRAEVAERTSAQVREGAAAAGGGTAPSVVRIVRDRYGVPHIFADSTAADPFTTLFMAGAGKPQGGRYVTDRGSSWTQPVQYRDGTVEVKTILPFGNSNDPASPHYADQMPLFAARQFKRALLTRTEIEAAATSTKILPYPGE